ncbi:MAG: hypothetical protein ACRDRL_28975 [Sciscionella sp.]
MIVKHPAFPEITHEVEDAEAWLAQGWLPLLDERQSERYRELEAEVADDSGDTDGED